jgi:SsrA-binding protein
MNKMLVENRKAKFDYEILETLEAGIALLGFEVKSVKAGQVSMEGSFANVYNGELYLLNVNIPAWQPKNAPKDFDPNRSRKLLLHKEEIKHLIGKIKEAKTNIIPLSFVLQNNKIKVQLGLGKSKKKKDKRETIKEREFMREKSRELKDY